MTFVVRPAKPSDAEVLPEIERSAGETFLTLPDLAWISSDEVSSPDDLRPLIAAGTVWVVDDQVGEPVGFLSAEAVDGELHLWEIAVAQAFQRHGLGRRLIDAAEAHARQAGLAALTLTTFCNVPWNAPAYEHMGFDRLMEAGDRLGALLVQEAERGLPDRCAMRKPLR